MLRRVVLSLSVMMLACRLARGAPDTKPPGDAAPAPAPASAPASSPLHDSIVADYMENRWDALEKTLKDKAKEISAMDREQQSDVTAIRLALKEGRQDWWATTKGGNKIPIKASLWGKTIPITFDPKTRYGTQITFKNGQQSASVGWMNGDMDSITPAEPGFTKGDEACLTAFANIGQIDSWSQVTPVAASAQIPLDRFLEFRGKVTGISYGTPGARRYGLWICLCSYGEEPSKLQIRMARRAVASMFIGELLTHPETYPSIEMPKNIPADKAEEALCNALADTVAKHPWTFAEDNAMRAAMKQFAVGNGSKCFTSASVTLPNKLTMSLDPKTDTTLGDRNAWFKQQLDKAGH